MAVSSAGLLKTASTDPQIVPKTLDFELYLPETWANAPERRTEARIPDDVQFKTKPELALEMIRRAVADNIPLGVILADSAYGTVGTFRDGVRELGLHYAVGVNPQTNVNLLDSIGRPRGNAVSVRELALQIHERGGFRRCTWREGTKNALSANFALRRVVTAKSGTSPPDEREALWLLIEWREGEPEPANYFLSSLPGPMTK
jgi:SRSO17 transposase